jgi:erythromycin esterase
MKSRLLILTLTLLQLHSKSQAVKDYVLNNTVTINSISISDTNYADLLPIAEAIGSSRMVLLGEQDHGDAPTFIAKARLVKYLHEKMGFEVLAFESDFYGLTRSWEEYKKGNSSFQQVTGNIFGYWPYCDAGKDLFDYISKTQASNNPVILTGFDNQIHGSFRSKHFREDFLAYLKSNSAPEHFSPELSNFLSIIQTTYPLDNNINLPQDSLLRYQKLLDSLIEWNKKLAPDNYFTILTTSLKSYLDQAIEFNKQNYFASSMRDRQMAANLKWISQYYYPDKKIIVWAASYHISKSALDGLPPEATNNLSMGYILFQDLKQEMYSLGFDSYEGTAGRLGIKPFELKKPKKNDMEEWLAAKNSEYAFVDFRKFQPEKKEMFYMKGKSHDRSQSNWNQVFDGVFFIKHMYACNLIKQEAGN